MDDSKNKEDILYINNVIESIDRELDFYRKRVFTVYSSIVTLQVLLITGQQVIKLFVPLWTNIAYSVVFVLLVIFVALFNASYKQRIYDLRHAKINLCNKAGYQGVFPEPGGSHSPSPSKLYVSTIALISALGLTIIWLGGH